MCTPVRIFAYYTAILEAIYNMQRTKKAKGQIVRRRGTEEWRRGRWERERESERGVEEWGGGREEEEEEGATRLHRSRSTVCKPSSIIKFLLARARARYTKVVLFLFRIVETYKNPFIALELRFDKTFVTTKDLHYACSNCWPDFNYSL